MAKRSRSSARRQPRPTRSISNLPAVRQLPTGDQFSPSWISESTNAPLIGESERTEGYAATSAELAHRFVEGNVFIRPSSLAILLPILWFCAIGWVFVQDNNAGKLQDWQGIKWFCAKGGLVTVAALLAGAVIGIGTYISPRQS